MCLLYHSKGYDMRCDQALLVKRDVPSSLPASGCVPGAAAPRREARSTARVDLPVSEFFGNNRAVPTLSYTLSQEQDVEWQKFKEMQADRNHEIILGIGNVRQRNSTTQIQPAP